MDALKDIKKLNVSMHMILKNYDILFKNDQKEGYMNEIYSSLENEIDDEYSSSDEEQVDDLKKPSSDLEIVQKKFGTTLLKIPSRNSSNGEVLDSKNSFNLNDL